MSASVRISRKTAQTIWEVCALYSPSPHEQRAFDELAAALAPKPKRPSVKAKEKRKRSKREETKEIREQIFERAGFNCEACGLAFWEHRQGELDHFWGRAKERQMVENCWALCRQCHHQKTLNSPSRVHWLEAFAAHCERHGYERQRQRALIVADVALDVKRAPTGRAGA